MEKSVIDKILKAGKIAQELRIYARSIVVRDRLLFEIADLIDKKISSLGAKPAFPVNLSMNEIAAHYTPVFGDSTLAHGLLKVDIGISVDGYIADTAFAVGKRLTEIGAEISSAISKLGFSSISNLSGHSIERFVVHAGWTVPNFDSGRKDVLEECRYATVPFATNGLSRVRDGCKSGIYRVNVDSGAGVRDRVARDVLAWIADEYKTLL